uniref:Uncharacterized protein n=1 Tax=Caenorhabditis japonica TaxID=281687 RepID=A0A8R1HX45_CAEJA
MSEFPNIDRDRLENNCFKAAWVATVLHDGFNVDKKNNQFQSVLEIAGEEMQWALGAMLYHTRNMKFESNILGDEEKMFRPSETVSNTFSLVVIIILVVAVGLIRSFQINSVYKRSRTESKSNLYLV